MVSIESYVVFAVFLAEVVKEEKSDKLTSNILLWFFSVQAVSLSNKSDFRQCIIMSMSLLLIVVKFLANEIASERRDSVMDESKLSMSNEADECFCMSGMLVNQLITSDVFFH